MKNKFVLTALIFPLLIILTGCKSNTNHQKVKKTNGVSISEVWMRPAGINRNSACFLKVTNNSDKPDTLIGVTSDLAKLVQMHRSYQNSDGTMGMEQVTSIPIEAKSIFSFKPGSYHVMLIGMNKKISLKDSGEISLQFRLAGEKTITAKVKNTFN